jgi:hypothetical protein
MGGSGSAILDDGCCNSTKSVGGEPIGVALSVECAVKDVTSERATCQMRVRKLGVAELGQRQRQTIGGELNVTGIQIADRASRRSHCEPRLAEQHQSHASPRREFAIVNLGYSISPLLRSCLGSVVTIARPSPDRDVTRGRPASFIEREVPQSSISFPQQRQKTQPRLFDERTCLFRGSEGPRLNPATRKQHDSKIRKAASRWIVDNCDRRHVHNPIQSQVRRTPR